jgi:tetratricopeptide (TPR) repeat protein
MKMTILVSAVVLGLATAGAGAVLESRAVAAEQSVSPKFGKPFNEASALVKAGKAKDALAKIQEAEAASSHSAFENLMLNKLKVGAYAQLGDNANMAKAAEAVVASGQVSGKELETFRKAAAQGYYNAGNIAKFSEYAKDDPDLQPLMAQALMKQGNYAGAEAAIRQAIASNPKEEYYLILAEAQRKSGNIGASADTIGTLLKSHPKPEYWKFVLGNMLNEKGLSDKGRLDIYRLMYATNSFSDAQDYTSMAETAIVAKSPGDAKRALDKGFKEGVLGKSDQATATQRNNDDLKGLPAIEPQAQAQAGGDALASIADSYLGNANYAKAISLYQTALSKGSLTDAAAAKLHLGVAYAGAKQDDAARKTLGAVPGKGLNKQLAGLWVITLH